MLLGARPLPASTWWRRRTPRAQPRLRVRRTSAPGTRRRLDARSSPRSLNAQAGLERSLRPGCSLQLAKRPGFRRAWDSRPPAGWPGGETSSASSAP
eukprot:9271400-Lingulodinium_polyedra.AAC.1